MQEDATGKLKWDPCSLIQPGMINQVPENSTSPPPAALLPPGSLDPPPAFPPRAKMPLPFPSVLRCLIFLCQVVVQYDVHVTSYTAQIYCAKSVESE